jgi:hypothetical protein
VFSFDVDHLVPVILLEYDGYFGEDGAQAISEVSEDTTTTIVNVSSGYYPGALRGPGDRFEDEVWMNTGALRPSGTATATPFVALTFPLLTAHHTTSHLRIECRTPFRELLHFIVIAVMSVMSGTFPDTYGVST